MAKRRTYTATQQMQYQRCGCDAERCPPPPWVLDRIAEEKLFGGFKLKTGKGRNRKSNVCPDCFVTKSLDGSCNCS